MPVIPAFLRVLKAAGHTQYPVLLSSTSPASRCARIRMCVFRRRGDVCHASLPVRDGSSWQLAQASQCMQRISPV